MSVKFVGKTINRMGNYFAGGEKEPVGITSNIDPGTAPHDHIDIGSKWSYSTLEYPMDIQQRSDLGHYMMFYVNVIDSNRSAYSTFNSMERKNTKKEKTYLLGKTNDSKDRMALRKEQANSKKAYPEGGREHSDAFSSDKGVYTPGQRPKIIGRPHYQGRLTNQQKQVNKRTIRTSDSVVLYMPPTIQVNTNAVYKSTEMGTLAMTLLGTSDAVYSKAQAGKYKEALLEALGFKDVAIEEVERMVGKTMSAIVGGDISAGYDKLSRRARNRYLETLFDGVGFRKFSYSFKFTPKSPDEALMARNIIKLFRFHMSPELSDAEGLARYFVPPAEFDIFYMYRDDQNEHLNKVSSCVLANMDVNYTNGRFQTFRNMNVAAGMGRGAPPTEIDMKLDFMETRIITKAEIEQGY